MLALRAGSVKGRLRSKSPGAVAGAVRAVLRFPGTGGCDVKKGRTLATPEPQTEKRLVVLAIYPWPEFWSMGEGCGAPSFHLSVTSFPRRGHELHVLMPGASGAPAEENYHGATLHRFRTGFDFMPEAGRSKILHHVRIFIAFVYWFVRAVPAALALAARVSPDVVFGMGSLGAPVARIVGVLRHRPNVTRLFGTELAQLAGSKLRLMARYRDIIAYRTRASYYILHNDGSGGDEVAVSYGVPRERIMFWPNGIDKEAYVRDEDVSDLARRLGVPDGSLVVMTASRLHPEKHVERLIAAAPDVLAELSDVVFLIVGDGESRAELEALARKLGISDKVLFAGAVPREAIPRVYKLADVFVALSDRTNMSNPLDEAMMSGLPVVVLNTGRTGDVVRSGENGILLEPGELPRLGRILVDLLRDEKGRRKLGEAARRTADARLPSVEERQVMEAGVVERAAREYRAALNR